MDHVLALAVKRHRHSQPKSFRREIDFDVRPDLLRKYAFQQHRSEPVAGGRGHHGPREFVPLADQGAFTILLDETPSDLEFGLPLWKGPHA